MFRELDELLEVIAEVEERVRYGHLDQAPGANDYFFDYDNITLHVYGYLPMAVWRAIVGPRGAVIQVMGREFTITRHVRY